MRARSTLDWSQSKLFLVILYIKPRHNERSELTEIK